MIISRREGDPPFDGDIVHLDNGWGDPFSADLD